MKDPRKAGIIMAYVDACGVELREDMGSKGVVDAAEAVYLAIIADGYEDITRQEVNIYLLRIWLDWYGN